MSNTIGGNPNDQTQPDPIPTEDEAPQVAPELSEEGGEDAPAQGSTSGGSGSGI